MPSTISFDLMGKTVYICAEVASNLEIYVSVATKNFRVGPKVVFHSLYG